jgi:hypothetical protein
MIAGWSRELPAVIVRFGLLGNGRDERFLQVMNHSIVCRPILQSPNEISRNGAQRWAAGKRHRQIKFLTHHFQNMPHAGFGTGSQPHKTGRPMNTARAPQAIALSTSVPRLIPPST